MDEFSRKKWTYALKSKAEAPPRNNCRILQILK